MGSCESPLNTSGITPSAAPFGPEPAVLKMLFDVCAGPVSEAHGKGRQMHHSNSFGDTRFLDELMSSNQAPERPPMSPTEGAAIESRTDGKPGSADDIVLDEVVSEIAEQFRLRDILEEACVATGATGAAIALARGDQMVCRATAGGDAPDLGVCLDPDHGLSGSCIQTRQLQQCNDTESDPRVDPEACRQLGVRSVVVLPLLRANELLGVFEILSSRPNAFGQGELDSLQALSCRILPRKLQEVEGTAKVSTKGSPSLPKSEEFDAQNKIPTPISDSGISHRHKGSKSRDFWTTILGVLVICAAVTLGALVGWRLGWERAVLHFRDLPRANAPSRPGSSNDILLPTVELPRSSAPANESRHRSGEVTNQRIPGPPKSPAHLPPGGGLTIHQGDKVIFRTPPSARPRAEGPQPAQHSPDLEENPSQQ